MEGEGIIAQARSDGESEMGEMGVMRRRSEARRSERG